MLLLHTKWKAKILLAQRLGVPQISQDLKLLTQMEGPKSKKNILNPAIIHLKKLTELWKGLYVLTTLRSVVGL